MLTLWTDAEITRRKRYFILQDEADQVIHRTAYLDDMLEHIWSLERQGVRVVSPRFTAVLRMIAPRNAKDPDKWQRRRPPS